MIHIMRGKGGRTTGEVEQGVHSPRFSGLWVIHQMQSFRLTSEA